MKFATLQEAQAYVKQRLSENSHEVCVGIDEKEGFFYAWFNVWN